MREEAVVASEASCMCVPYTENTVVESDGTIIPPRTVLVYGTSLAGDKASGGRREAPGGHLIWVHPPACGIVRLLCTLPAGIVKFR